METIPTALIGPMGIRMVTSMSSGTALKPSAQQGEQAATKTAGITAADVIAVFPGARVTEIRGRCTHCAGARSPAWRRGGKLVQATNPDGQKKLICSFCGGGGGR